MNLLSHIKNLDKQLINQFDKYSHWIHRISLGFFIAWIGLLKLVGYKTNTALIAHSIYWGDPETMVQVLGFWELIIGLCFIIKPLIRIAIFLLVLRLPGIILAFILKNETCFYHFPLAPTIEGQYLIKDFIMFFAALAIASSLGKK